MTRVFALIPAAGVGSRVGGAIPKQYLSIAGKPMIVHTLAAFAQVAPIERIVVVIAADDRRFDAIALAPPVVARIDVVRRGGATRDATVANGLDAMRDIAADDDWVLVHDAARCGIEPALIEAMIRRTRADPVGGLLAVPLDDTVKREAVDAPSDGPARVATTVDRRGLWRAQTPQMFRYRKLRDAIAAARDGGFATTDEAGAMEAAGHRVLLIPGSPRNFKVTSADDVAMMDLLLRDDAGGASGPPIAAHPT